jgi:hypothetical protein
MKLENCPAYVRSGWTQKKIESRRTLAVLQGSVRKSEIGNPPPTAGASELYSNRDA